MKYVKTFEYYSKKEISDDNKYYKKFISSTKEELEQIRQDYVDLKREALKNLNKDLHDKDNTGSISSSDVSDTELFDYLDKEKSKKFQEYSRVLDFKDGFKRKENKKKVNEMMSKIPDDDKKKSDKEIIRAAIIAEYDAINLYEQLSKQAKNENIKKVLLDIAKEEKTHVGEFETLLVMLDKEHEEELKNGEKEIEELIKNK
jgi:hypothetical protein